jgi:anti-sigma B factor antagonist
MKFSFTESHGMVIISFDGAILGGPEAAALNQELHLLMDQRKTKVIIDLTNVSLMNSSGLGVLISCYATVNNAHGILTLAGANATITSLIEVTRLHTIFQLFPTVEAAVTALQ